MKQSGKVLSSGRVDFQCEKSSSDLAYFTELRGGFEDGQGI